MSELMFVLLYPTVGGIFTICMRIYINEPISLLILLMFIIYWPILLIIGIAALLIEAKL